MQLWCLLVHVEMCADNIILSESLLCPADTRLRPFVEPVFIGKPLRSLRSSGEVSVSFLIFKSLLYALSQGCGRGATTVISHYSRCFALALGEGYSHLTA